MKSSDICLLCCNIVYKAGPPVVKLSLELKCSKPVRFVAEFSKCGTSECFHFKQNLVLGFMRFQHNLPCSSQAAQDITNGQTREIQKIELISNPCVLFYPSLVSYPFNSSTIWGCNSSSLSFSIFLEIDSALLIATNILAYKSFTAALVLSIVSSSSPLTSWFLKREHFFS
ncbi:hypothetical protein TorRG33x02_142270 [Trema orientale]|uniref:Uncharacterized protein n=1 Tax=Trema orientale TaxID=63057 RepID=A0A2P5EWM4_TREOI|nr:hypothetical protein TorRG33x02_142270 [Trema orientale]